MKTEPPVSQQEQFREQQQHLNSPGVFSAALECMMLSESETLFEATASQVSYILI